MKIIGVIPARYQSSRLPGKPIVNICGKPMIWWVYKTVINSNKLSDVVIATDDERIEKVCKDNDMNVVMTAHSHTTPTSRLYEVSTKIDADLFVMIMGDEPLVDVRAIDLIIPSGKIDEYYVGALSNKIDEPTEVIDFSNQKVVTNCYGEVMLISRSPIPYPKGILDFPYYKVTGIQVFSRKALDFYNKTGRSILELAEENDLMRFVEHKIPVIMKLSPYKTISVDTKKDLEMVSRIISDKKNGK